MECFFGDVIAGVRFLNLVIEMCDCLSLVSIC